MDVVMGGTPPSGSFEPFALSFIHGVVLALILVGLLRLPRWLPFARIVIGIGAAFVLFLLIDDLVNGSVRANAGLLCGAALVIAVAALTRRRHRRAAGTG